MIIHPKTVVFPAILIVCAVLTLISMRANQGYSLLIGSSPKAFPPASENEKAPLSSGFPSEIQQWKPSIEKYAANFGLDANLIAAVILQESGGQPAAVSANGAVGLMQIMPRDGVASQFICINGPCFQDRPATEELFDPTFNIQFGASLLSELIKREGNLRDALKAYGPAEIDYHYADIVLTLFERYKQAREDGNPPPLKSQLTNAG